METWTGPEGIVGTEIPCMYQVQNTVSGGLQTLHLARLSLFSDSQLTVTADTKDVFQHAWSRGY